MTAPGRGGLFAFVLAASLACGGADTAPSTPDEAPVSQISYGDVTEESGVRFLDTHGRPGTDKRYLFETIGGGVALFDQDGDGDLDMFLAGGDPQDGTGPAPSRLFANRGDARFDDVTEALALDLRRDATGLAVGDVDDDGDEDLYVGAYGVNALLENRGSTLVDVATQAGVDHPGYASAVLFADFDGDGDLDLFVGNYVEWNEHALALSAEGGNYRGHMVIAGPRGLHGAADVLFENVGFGPEGVRFRDVTESAGLGESRSFALGAVAADVTGDGRIDLYVANDSEPNSLFENQGGMRFVDVGVVSGSALDASGQAQAGMGVDAGDADGDGDLDLFVTNFSHDHNTYYEQHGPGRFSDMSRRAGLFQPSYLHLGFGCTFTDADLDGDLDLVVANGHVFAVLDDTPLNTTYAQVNQVFENLSDGEFREVPAPWVGPGHPTLVSRGLARGDLDGDGREDLVVTNLNGPVTVLRNRTPTPPGMVLELRGVRSGARAVGAKVEVELKSGRRIVRHVCAGGSFQSASCRRIVLGVPRGETVRRIHVHWPWGKRQVFDGPPLGHLALLVEGERDVQLEPLAVYAD